MIHPKKNLRKRSVFDKANQRSGPMMTPMVDVVLVILIFFMASTSIAGYEWFLQASVEPKAQPEGMLQQSRFSLPKPVIQIDLVQRNNTATMVYGIRGQSAVSLEQAVEIILAMDITQPSSLKVAIGAGDTVPMGDVMKIQDAWNERSIRVIMRVGR